MQSPTRSTDCTGVDKAHGSLNILSMRAYQVCMSSQLHLRAYNAASASAKKPILTTTNTISQRFLVFHSISNQSFCAQHVPPNLNHLPHSPRHRYRSSYHDDHQPLRPQRSILASARRPGNHIPHRLVGPAQAHMAALGSWWRG